MLSGRRFSRRFVAALACAMGIVLVGATIPALAGPMEPVNDDWNYQVEIDEVVQSAPAGTAVAGQVFLDENYFNSSKLFADFTGETCTAIDKGLCAKAGMVTMQTVMPHCSARRSTDCVDQLFVGSGSKRVKAARAGTFVPDGSTSFPAIELFDGTTLPGGGELSLWRLPEYPHSGGDLYAVSMTLSGVLSRLPLGWRPQPLEVSTQIVPVSKTPWNGEYETCPDEERQSGDTCLTTAHRLPDEPFGVSVRVGSSFGSWVFGRVADLKIDVRERRGQNLLTVSGRPAVTPHAVGATSCEPGSTILGEFCPYFGARTPLNDAGSPLSLKAWQQWAPYVGQQSDALIRKWSFRSNEAETTALSGCLKEGEISGWISTNAMVFAAEPPAWNGRSLDFSVAGPPLTPTGERASGDYEFFLRSSVASCLWKTKSVAKRATIQVLNSGSSTEVTTTSVGESKGWVRFVARNFGFPDVPTPRSIKAAAVKVPTISIKLKGKRR